MARFEKGDQAFTITSNDARYATELRKHLHEGWTRVCDLRCEVQLGAEPRNATFEHALHADPDDIGTKLVYADWLQQQGHPRGALIAVQHRLASTPNDSSLVEEERRIIEEAGEALVSRSLAAHLSLRRGDVEIAPSRNFFAGGAITFDHGFLREAKLDLRARTADEDLVWELLRHPSSRALVKLAIELDRSRDVDLVAALLMHGPVLPLRSLVLKKAGPNSAAITFERIGIVYPQLEELEITVSYARFVDASLPQLRRLVLWDTLDNDIGTAVAGMPALEDLTLSRPDPDKLDAVFELPKLRLLRFAAGADAFAICRLLARSRVAAQIEQLVFEKMSIANAVGYLVQNRAKFLRLVKLEVVNGIAAHDRTALREADYPI